MQDKVILLTWRSENHDPDVLKHALDWFSGNKQEVEKVIYLYQESQSNAASGIANAIANVQTQLVDVKDPTDHKEIYNQIKTVVLPLLKDCDHLYINISPGTPAMHSVWLILFAGGAFPKNTVLISTQLKKDTKKQSVQEVDFPITTYLGEIRKLERENKTATIYNPEAKSTARRDALEKVKIYSRIQGVPLLLIGERGIGKTCLVESYVKTIKKKEVVSLACGSLDSNLAESEIFGHTKGAFTGATTDRKGLLEQAKGKILFLDEIQDLPKSVQRKLLRTLQDKKHRYRKLGDDKELSADIELVCASNLPDEDLRQKLDADFYDRISFYKVELPPLRLCREDIQEDWERVWNSVRLDKYEEMPWSQDLEYFLSKSDLAGNFRSLQTLAYQFLAWKDKKTHKEILASLTFERDNAISFSLGNFEEFQGLSWQDATMRFQNALSNWAKEKYGTWEKAAQALACSSRVLMKHVKK